MSTKKIRNVLMKELDDLMSGKAELEHAQAVTKVAAQAIYATRIELENKRMEVALEINTDEDRMKFIDATSVSVPSLNL